MLWVGISCQDKKKTMRENAGRFEKKSMNVCYVPSSVSNSGRRL